MWHANSGALENFHIIPRLTAFYVKRLEGNQSALFTIAIAIKFNKNSYKSTTTALQC